MNNEETNLQKLWHQNVPIKDIPAALIKNVEEMGGHTNSDYDQAMFDAIKELNND